MKLTYLLIIFLIFNKNLLAEPNIGTIELVNGNVDFNCNDKSGMAEIYDDIYIGCEYQLSKNASLTFSFEDNSTFIISNGAKVKIDQYENIFSPKPYFEISIFSGEIMVETGDIPKISEIGAKVKTPNGDLILKGTAISGSFENNKSKIFLLTDSFGNQGNLTLVSEKGEELNFEADKGFEFNDGTASQSNLDDEQLSKIENLKTTIVENAVVDQEKIDQIVNKKIAEGKISIKDAENMKKDILSKKESQINSIINKTTKENSSLLSGIMQKSSEQSLSSIMTKVVDSKPEITSSLVEKIVETNPDKIQNLSKNDSNLMDKIITTSIANADENDTSLSKIISKVDGDLSSKLIEKISDEKSEILTNVIAQVSVENNQKVLEIVSKNEDLGAKIVETITENIKSDINSVEKLKTVLLSTDPKLSSSIIERIEKTDSSIAKNAIKQAINENQAGVEKNLSQSFKDKNSSFSKLVIEESLKSGKQEIITKAADNLIKEPNNATNKNTNDKQILNNISQNIQETTAKILIDDPKAKLDDSIIKILDEKLASPN